MGERRAFLFSGQGTQYVGMGQGIDESKGVKDVFKNAYDATG